MHIFLPRDSNILDSNECVSPYSYTDRKINLNCTSYLQSPWIMQLIPDVPMEAFTISIHESSLYQRNLP